MKILMHYSHELHILMINSLSDYLTNFHIHFVFKEKTFYINIFKDVIKSFKMFF